MRKSTRKINGAYARFTFWQTLTTMLTNFDAVVKHKEHLTPEDVRVQKRIHRALYDCYTMSKEMREQRRKELETLIV